MTTKSALMKILTISIVSFLFATTMIGTEAGAATAPVLAVNPYANKGNIGTTITVNVTLAQTTKIPNYQFKLNFNKTILSANSATSLAPFETSATIGGAVLNNTAGYVFMAYYTFLGDDNGVTTVDPVTVATIEFAVIANGTTPLHLTLSRMTDTLGNPIDPLQVDGVFSNVAAIQKHDLSITGFTVSPTSVTSGDSVSISVIVKNNGDFNETFAVSTDYNGTSIGNETNISINTGESKTVNVSWDTSDVPAGTYSVTAEVNVAVDVNPADNTRSETVIVSGGGGNGLSFNMYLVAAGIVIVIVIVAIGIYIMRARRKPA